MILFFVKEHYSESNHCWLYIYFIGVLVTIRSSSVSIAKCYQGTAERNLTTQLGIECIRTFSSCQQRSEQWQEDRYREVECTLKTVVQTLLVTPGLGRLVSEICPPCELISYMLHIRHQ